MPRCFVIGAGVVGLSIGRTLSKNMEVIILEARNKIGTQTSSRNSEVIHSGIYYRPGSMKAKLCASGADKLYKYIAQRHVQYRNCGKLIVATSPSDYQKLKVLSEIGEKNGVKKIALLTKSDVKTIEPELECLSALRVPSTGIVNSHELMMALQADAESNGAVIVFNCNVHGARRNPEVSSRGRPLLELNTSQGDFAGDVVINCAGHGAPYVAARVVHHPLNRVPRPYFSKGSYFKLAGAK